MVEKIKKILPKNQKVTIYGGLLLVLFIILILGAIFLKNPNNGNKKGKEKLTETNQKLEGDYLCTIKMSSQDDEDLILERQLFADKKGEIYSYKDSMAHVFKTEEAYQAKIGALSACEDNYINDHKVICLTINSVEELNYYIGKKTKDVIKNLKSYGYKCKEIEK